ncbi:MAG: ferrous iron transport protein B [Crocinitomicaceae bacterium]|nr:ferrous iron transport protein B [Crocinitomicaceae bacterium]|tara:strand:- start:13892 stop:15871 length:1980 start_codon:yes stop_codon:yes gene_type:complete
MDALLVGNPNCGKTSLFNQLTGLNQKVGNYPGITVEKREGYFKQNDEEISVTDLPGIYSLYPGSEDEKIAVQALLAAVNKPSTLVLCVIDIKTPHKNLLLLSQIAEFGIPLVGILNYRRKSKPEEIDNWHKNLTTHYNLSFVKVNANSGKGIDDLKSTIVDQQAWAQPEIKTSIQNLPYDQWIKKALEESGKQTVQSITQDLRKKLEWIDAIFPSSENAIETKGANPSFNRSAKLDSLLMHPLWGYVLFSAFLLIIFQAIFSWSAYPMDLIEYGFGALSTQLQNILPSNFITNSITDGIIPGLAGVVVFVPQIAFLFLFIALFEESGYMSRVVYLMDRLVKPFGLSGKSVVPLISGYACAIPAIMSTRTIKHPRERLITMLVIPFMTCSARIPVYTTLIALMVSSEAKLGFLNVQGLVLFAMYFFGAFMSFFIALISNKILAGKGRSLLLMELPNYKIPSFKTITLTMYEKSKSFVLQAGKVILLVSLVLYFMANIGFNETFERIENNDPTLVQNLSPNEVAKLKLENSLIGQLGKGIEPAIKPLGYDWKIGISLITSFAAREVFVGTMATIYALEEDGEDTSSIVQQMRNDRDENGDPKYSLAVILSLLVFYALAMQCLGTVAVMNKETQGWKWPIIQLVVASGTAYVLAFIVFQIFK